MTNADDRAALIARTEAELGPIDILVNNAGVETVAHFERCDEAEIVHTIEVNLVSAMLLTRTLLPGMLERKRGHIVNIVSGAGKVGVPFAVAYAASKHGLVGFTNSLRCEFEKSPVSFSVVCPALVSETGMYARWEVRGAKAPRSSGVQARPRSPTWWWHASARIAARCWSTLRPFVPLVVLANIAPGLTPRLMRTLGYSRMFKRAAELTDAE